MTNNNRWTKVKNNNNTNKNGNENDDTDDGRTTSNSNNNNNTTLPPGMSPPSRTSQKKKRWKEQQKQKKKHQEQQQQIILVDTKTEQQQQQQKEKLDGRNSNTFWVTNNDDVDVNDGDDTALLARIMEESLFESNTNNDSNYDGRYKRLRKLRKKLSEAKSLYSKTQEQQQQQQQILLLDQEQQTKVDQIPIYQCEIELLVQELDTERFAKNEKEQHDLEQLKQDNVRRMEEWKSFSEGMIVQGFGGTGSGSQGGGIEEEEFACPLCAGPFEAAVITTNCRHVFCRACLEDSFSVAAARSHGDPESIRCPMCRSCLLDPSSTFSSSTFPATTTTTNTHNTGNMSSTRNSSTQTSTTTQFIHYDKSNNNQNDQSHHHLGSMVLVEAATKIRRKMKKKRCVCRCGTEISLASLRIHLRSCTDGALTLFEHELERMGHEPFKSPTLDPIKVQRWKKRIKQQQKKHETPTHNGGSSTSTSTSTRGEEPPIQYYSGSTTIPEGYDEDAEIQAAILQSLCM